MRVIIRKKVFSFIKNKRLEFKIISWFFVALKGKIGNRELRFKIQRISKN